jgi:hypothetical protein
MGDKKRVYLSGLAALVLGATLFSAAPARADPGPHVIPIDPASVDDPNALLQLYTATDPGPSLVEDPTATARCGPASTAPVPDGVPIQVLLPPAPVFTVGQIPASSWRNPPSADPTWRLNYLGLMWMKSLARRAAMDNQLHALTDLVSQVVAFHKENPDPKNSLYGWDEGTALRRLETENCLYSVSRSSRLIAGMTADANVLLGSRYYGPPNFRVHNHGLMANIQLVRAATLIGKPTWKSTAISRMTSEAPQAFSKLGTSYEQSSMYQLTNASLWEQAATLLAETPGSESAAAAINKTVAAAYRIYGWMTEPDGNIPQIGDSYEIAGRPIDLGDAVRSLKDDQAGWIIGRWGWTDPNATYYTLRYGPARFAHGHHDRAGGVTYSVNGVRVLVGPGAFTYDDTSNYKLYQINPQGQNVAIPSGGKLGNGAATATSVIRGPNHRYSVSDTVYGLGHSRGVIVDRDLRHMVVSDAFTGASVWRQSWHLDPQWALVAQNSTSIIFSHPSGRRLTVTTTGRVSGVVQGITRPPAGWHFPTFGSRVWANEITIRNYGTACTTTFTVN